MADFTLHDDFPMIPNISIDVLFVYFSIFNRVLFWWRELAAVRNVLFVGHAERNFIVCDIINHFCILSSTSDVGN